ncbi:hypothetical protein NLJ89_g7722 [Agrocybe chaxingu]|uniref:Fungal-type protein kinase domain-containing protein n=1 Tax=Agrocybe chaxingu TaxID=84603 RepID=A0A9W8JVU1_9AGAR|nr:hypothetical protein NLJ89_g7722 [Agrocybe chaxingu]
MAKPEAYLSWIQEALDEDYFSRVVRKKVRASGFSNASIAKFVKTCSLYDRRTKRWNEMKPATAKASDLSAQFLRIFKEVLSAFGIGDRTVIDTLSATTENNDSKTMPELFVLGEGSNFSAEDMKPSSKVDYIYCASPCKVLTMERTVTEDILGQVANYAWRCFAEQGNRLYVYSLAMTEEEVLPLQYDRNGVLCANGVNIHDRPEDFVRLILLVCSPDCATLGFDTSVYWKGSKRYIRTAGEENELVEYEILDSRHFFYRRELCGHGTVCWRVKDPEGRLRIIKDNWLIEGCDAEKDLLLKLKGVDGVGQIVAYEEQKWTISMLRGMEDHTEDDGRADRLFRRVILEAYGKPIDKFKDRIELLYAFRDAVAGHQNMWKQNIIHRDISINNILIGGADAPKGRRGILIDLDVAVQWEYWGSMPAVDVGVGTRAFKSIFVLRSELDKKEGRMPLAHDHLDDLESFFYVFCCICMSQDSQHTKIECEELQAWEDNKPVNAMARKYLFLLSSPSWHNHINAFFNFGRAFQELFYSLRDCLRGWVESKAAMRRRRERVTDLEKIRRYSDEHYATFLGHIDTAIKEVEDEERRWKPIPQPISPSTPRPPSQDGVAHMDSGQQPKSSRGVKRKHNQRGADTDGEDLDRDDAAPALKRPRTRLWAKSQPGATAPAVPSEPSARRQSSRLRTGTKQLQEVPPFTNVTSSTLNGRRAKSGVKQMGATNSKKTAAKRGQKQSASARETTTAQHRREVKGHRRGRSASSRNSRDRYRNVTIE